MAHHTWRDDGAAVSAAGRRSVLSAQEAVGAFADMLKDLGAREVALVRNPRGVHAPFEFYPLAPRTAYVPEIRAVLMDMDGTTTTTEPLCLHSLEHMVRLLTGREDRAAWPGLDPESDLPHVVGNSTTRHVEHLLDAYQAHVDPRRFARCFLSAAAWTLVNGRDPVRGVETEADLSAMGLGARSGARTGLLDWGGRGAPPDGVAVLENDVARRLTTCAFAVRVRCAVTIYYRRYHEILARIDAGGGRVLASEVLGSDRGDIIEPMDGVAVFLAMIKGLLGEEGARLIGVLGGVDGAGGATRFLDLCRRFAARPARLGVVTSSIAYEAGIVLREALRVMASQAAAWPVGAGLRERCAALFGSTDSLYDVCVTASDSSEMRLKPHRDLYAIALARLGLKPEEYCLAAGFEDSAAGVTAIKAAGVGLCVAVPFEFTAGHDFSAADHVVRGGFPELILERGLFMSPPPAVA